MMPPGKSLSSKVRLPSSAWAHLAHTTSIEACFGRSDPVPGRSNVWKHWRFGTFERAGQVRVCCARGQAHPGSATKMGHQRPVPPLFLSGLMACRWPSCRKHVPINWLTTPLLHRHYIVTTPSIHHHYTGLCAYRRLSVAQVGPRRGYTLTLTDRDIGSIVGRNAHYLGVNAYGECSRQPTYLPVSSNGPAETPGPR
jgi:hypothetical protein